MINVGTCVWRCVTQYNATTTKRKNFKRRNSRGQIWTICWNNSRTELLTGVLPREIIFREICCTMLHLTIALNDITRWKSTIDKIWKMWFSPLSRHFTFRSLYSRAKRAILSLYFSTIFDYSQFSVHTLKRQLSKSWFSNFREHTQANTWKHARHVSRRIRWDRSMPHRAVAICPVPSLEPKIYRLLISIYVYGVRRVP